VAEEILALDKVCKAYNVGTLVETEVLHDIDLVMRRSEFLALMGPSGSGKSTLLNIIGLLDRPTSGHLYINGQDTSALGESELTRLRSHSIGFVFQYHYLISAFTALENVMMPMLVDQGFPTPDVEGRAGT
jgi:lipoprotein-releasing system ATP-binding protein